MSVGILILILLLKKLHCGSYCGIHGGFVGKYLIGIAKLFKFFKVAETELVKSFCAEMEVVGIA